MTRLIAFAFAAVVAAAGLNGSAVAAPSFCAPYAADAVSAEPVRICWQKFCDPRGKCTYRPAQCPRGPAQ